MPTLHRQDNIFVLDLGDGENRFHPDWIASVDAGLDEVEKADELRALVTAATGKVYSNGLDLDWLSAHVDQHRDHIVSVQELFARVLSLPVITVAALQGHAFAAGAMLSLAHDFRVMRATAATGVCPRSTSTFRSPPAWPPSSRPGWRRRPRMRPWSVDAAMAGWTLQPPASSIGRWTRMPCAPRRSSWPARG